jgi:Xaa-Pro aminopeptidase
MIAFIHTDENAVYYECGYSNDNCIYLALGSVSYLLTDSRYTLDATTALKKSSPNTKVVIDFDLSKRVAKLISKVKIRKIAFDPKEWDYYRITQIQEYTRLRWVAKPDLSQKKRLIKTQAEIEILAKAVKQGARAFRDFAMMIDEEGVGKTEKELHFLAENFMRRFGKNALSFDPIVAIGVHAAKPHAHPTDRVLEEGDLLLFDAGLKHKRYCSDRTRTVRVREGFVFNKKQKFDSKKLQRAYDAVLKAHGKQIEKAQSGMRASQIDKIGREIIDKAGFGKYFIHSTGHGVGLDIHELPIISGRSKTKIEDGMVYTIEPGIYIPDSFGIRIEDMVVMREGSAEVL